jgi:hypothetical protein
MCTVGVPGNYFLRHVSLFTVVGVLSSVLALRRVGNCWYPSGSQAVNPKCVANNDRAGGSNIRVDDRLGDSWSEIEAIPE